MTADEALLARPMSFVLAPGVVLLPGTLMIAAMIFTSTYFSFRDCFLTEDDGTTPPASRAP